MPTAFQPALRRFLAVGLLCWWAATLRAQGPALQAELLPSNEIRLAWPTAAGSFQLEASSELRANPDWTVVAGTPSELNGTWSVTLTPSADIRLFRLRSLPGALTRIIETSPAAGESGVAVTRETIVRLSEPLAAHVQISNDQFHATFGGRRILSRIQIGTDRRSFTLFFLEPLPGGARVRITLDATGLRDSAGRDLDADGNGSPGGVLTLDFSTTALQAVADTAVVGRVFSSELAPAPGGESIRVPLAGVTVTVDGMEETMRTVTDQFGNFRLSPVPAGEFFVHLDGRTAIRTIENPFPQGAFYPFVGKLWHSLAGQEVNIDDVYLPLIIEGTLQPVSPTQPTVVTFPPSVLAEHPELAGVALAIPANALFSDLGSRGGSVGIAPVPPDRLPEPLPAGLDFPIVITVQTDGPTNFDQPVPICFPNLPDPATGFVRPPGTKSALWSFNHDIGDWEVVGPMTVSADGKLVCTDPGVGIRQPGWHGESPGNQASGGRTRNGNRVGPTRPRNTADQECAQNDCPCEGNCSTGHEIFLQSGEEVLTRTDLMIPGRAGLDFRMERTYRSRLDFNGPIGFGWTFRYNEALFIEPSGDVTRFTGRSHGGTWAVQPDGTYTTPPGYFSVLLRMPDGGFLLVEPDGFQRLYQPDGRLYCHADRYGNRMLFDYDPRGNLSRVIDVFGREIQFRHETGADGVERIVRVEDFAGRVIRYQYDARGDLVSVTTPAVTGTSTGNDFPNGRTERYTYSGGFAQADLNHNILSMTLPVEVAGGGPPMLVWTYGNDPASPMTFDRVLSETEGGLNASGIPAGGTRWFDYSGLNGNEPPGQPDLPRGLARITERNGNRREFYVNERQLHILTREFTRGLRDPEPDFFETRSQYDDDGQLVRRIHPEGNEERFVYDTNGPRRSRGNLLQHRRVADPERSGGNDLVTTYTYEPLFNQVRSRTDPRGNDPAFVPPLGVASPGRYTKRFFYDYQESNAPVPLANLLGIDLSGIPRGLGDLNGDGRIDQVVGNRIRIEAPAVQLRPDSNEAARLGSTTQRVIRETRWNDHGQVVAEVDPEGNVTEIVHHPETDPDGDGVAIFAPYVALAPTLRNGYVATVIADARTSPRRDPNSPPPLALATAYEYDTVGNVTGVRSPRGIWTRFEINALNEVVAMSAGDDITAAVEGGQLLTGEDPFRFQTRFHYDANGRVVRKERENRHGTTPDLGPFVQQRFTYDILDDIVTVWSQVTAQHGVTTEFRYDADQFLLRTVEPEGNAIVTVLDERNLPLFLTRGDGTAGASTLRFDYDLNGNRIRVTDAQDNDGDGQPEVFRAEYDGFDRVTASIDALGNRTAVGYDPGSNPMRQREFGHPADQPSGNSVLLADVRLDVDEVGRTFRTRRALFVPAGNAPVRAPELTDADGDGFVVSLTEFDAASRLTATVEDDGEVHRRSYDGAGRLIRTFDPLGNTVTLSYDRDSNPVREVRREVASGTTLPPQEFTYVRVYDQLDRLVRSTDPAGQTTRFVYDSRDNRIAQSDAEGPLIADPLGLVPGQINGPGNTAETVFDGLSRVIATVRHLRQGGTGAGAIEGATPFNSDGAVTVAYVWDGNSRLIGIRDDRGNTTTFSYDPLNRRTRRSHADGTAHTTVYDREDNAVETIDANGTVVRHTHDVLGRRTRSEVTRFGPGVTGSAVHTYAYDGLSRLIRSTDDNGAPGRTETSEWVYDSLGRIFEERQNGQVLSAALAGDGRRVATTLPGGRRIDRSFDAIDRVRQQRDGAQTLSDSLWIGPGTREITRANGNGTLLTHLNDAGTATTGFDLVKRPVRQRVLRGATPLVDREYAYNRGGWRTSEIRHDDTGMRDAYAYDSLYRLVSAEFDSGGSGGGIGRQMESTGYALDGAGNRRKVRRTGEVPGNGEFEVTASPVNAYTQIAGTTLAHSANGVLLDDGTRLFAYDSRDRLVNVWRKSDQALVAEYRYDAENRRRQKSVWNPDAPGVAPRITRYVYDGWSVCEEQGAAGQTETTFVQAPTYIDAFVQMQRTAAHPLGAGTFYFHQNARHDVVALTDGAGEVVERSYYDDFGRLYDGAKQRSPGSAVGNPYAFQGARLDPETGLYYFRHRYYDPDTGRFLQRDPEWDPNNHANLYTFAGNSPASLLDPSGLNSGSGRAATPNHRTRTRPPAPAAASFAEDPAVAATGGLSRALNAAGTASRTKVGEAALDAGRAAGQYWDAYNEMRFLENMSNLNHAGPEVSNAYKSAKRFMAIEETLDAAGGLDAAKTAGTKAKIARAAGHVGNALQAAEVAANAVDYYQKDERVKNLSANERERILDEYDRLSREALSMRNPCIKEKLLRDLRENMEFQLENATSSQINEHLINGAVFLRDSLATFVPLPTGWLWGNSEQAGRP